MRPLRARARAAEEWHGQCCGYDRRAHATGPGSARLPDCGAQWRAEGAAAMRLLAVIAISASLMQAQMAMRPHILGVAHIALRVSDIDQSRAFYKDFLGLAEPFQLNNTNGSLALTFIKINDTQYIELFPGLKSDEDRLHHISIQTDNAEGMRVYLASRGIKVPDRVPKGRIGNLNFNVQDPDGHTLEIVEYAPDGWSMREKGKYEPGTRVS